MKDSQLLATQDFLSQYKNKRRSDENFPLYINGIKSVLIDFVSHCESLDDYELMPYIAAQLESNDEDDFAKRINHHCGYKRSWTLIFSLAVIIRGRVERVGLKTDEKNILVEMLEALQEGWVTGFTKWKVVPKDCSKRFQSCLERWLELGRFSNEVRDDRREFIVVYTLICSIYRTTTASYWVPGFAKDWIESCKDKVEKKWYKMLDKPLVEDSARKLAQLGGKKAIFSTPTSGGGLFFELPHQSHLETLYWTPKSNHSL